MSTYPIRKKRKKRKRVKKNKNLNKSRTCVLRPIKYKTTRGHPKLNLWINSEEKKYIDERSKEISLYEKSLRIKKEERRKKNDFDIVIEKLEKMDNLFVKYKKKYGK